MSRINTNISSLTAIHRLTQNNSDLAMHLQRLSSGLQINSGKDAPAGLIASEQLRGEIGGINQAIDNSQRAGNVVSTAEGALGEVSALLLEVQGLTNEAANSGALSPQEIQANQLQTDAILNSINRIANTTQFNGVKLLDGSLDYSTNNLDKTKLSDLQVNAAQLPEHGSESVVVGVTASAKTGQIAYATGALSDNVTLEIKGNAGTENLSFSTGSSEADLATAVNAIKASTGVSATASGDGSLYFNSVGYGTDQYASVQAISGTFVTDKQLSYGKDAAVTINGQKADVRGLTASVRSSDLDLTVSLAPAFGTAVGTTAFDISGGGARFQLGSEVNRQSQVNLGISAVATTRLGNSTDGPLASMGSGQANSLVSGNTIQAQRILTAAIKQVAEIRGRLGAFQKDVLQTNTNNLQVALENVTASESAIRDADFASETAALTRSQILVQANTSVLAQANATPQSVLSLLK